MTKTRIRFVLRDHRGASAVEYGLLIAAIAAVIVLVVFGLGGIVSQVFADTSDVIDSCVGGGC